MLMILPQVHLRNGFSLPHAPPEGTRGVVTRSPRSPGGPDYILSAAPRRTHSHLVCERLPVSVDVGASLRIAHALHRSGTIQVGSYRPPCCYHGPPGGFPLRVGAPGFRVSPSVRKRRRRGARIAPATTCVRARIV